MGKRALNFLSHVVYNNGLVCFVSCNVRYDHLIQKTARESGEFFITREFPVGRFTDIHRKLSADARLPDVIIGMNFSRFDEGMKQMIREATVCNIPVIGILDTDCNPLQVTYPIPGNDDSPVAMQLYCD